MEKYNIMKSWDGQCKNECKYVRVCEQIREMCSWIDRYNRNVVQLLNVYIYLNVYMVLRFKCVGIV